MSQADNNEEVFTLKYIESENCNESSLIEQLIIKHRKKNLQNSFKKITPSRYLKKKVQTKYIPTV